MELARMFQGGGWMMYPLMLIAMAAWPASLVLPAISVFSAKRSLALVFAMLLAALGLLAAGLGALGMSLGMQMVNEAIAHVNPADQETIRHAGLSEARACVLFGLVIAAAPLGAACVALGRAVTEQRRALAVGGGIVLGLAVAFLFIALAGQQYGMIQADAALANVEPSMKATLAAAGASQSAQSLKVGLMVAVPLALVGAGLLFAGARSGKAPTA